MQLPVYWTKSKGTGGRIKSEEDFVVEELPLRKFFSKYTRSSSGVKTIDGPYVLAILKKKGMTTKHALDLIGKEIAADVGYAGLKDKFAVTSQYVTIRKEAFRELKTGDFELSFVSFTDKMMQVGELEGNKFIITLHDCKKPENAEGVLDELKKRGMPNYFGSQRFGKHGDNHIIGRLILQRNYKDALKLINKQNKIRYTSLPQVDKKTLKFFLHSYQSYIFNTVLDRYVSKNSKLFSGYFQILGFDTKLENRDQIKKLLEKDGIKQEDFEIRDLNIKCEGSTRPAFVPPKILAYSISGKTLCMEFELPKGSYATVLIGEVTKSA